MSSIEDLKIVGFDADRLPRMRKEAYIDLFFQLSEKAPADWCEKFNSLGRQMTPPPKIDVNKGEFIDSYVKSMDQIPTHFGAVKKTIQECTKHYLEKIRQQQIAQAASNSAMQGESGEQLRLNKIVESLDFDS